MDRSALRRILVSFGGSDPLDITGRALAALTDPAFAGIAVDVVVGINYRHRENLERLAAARPLTTLHGHQPTLLPLLGEADLAVGAGGTTTWERLCLGVPSVVVCIAENQRPGCEYLAGLGCIEYCGDAAIATADAIAASLRRCVTDEARRREMTAAGQVLVDGLGAQRIAERMAPTATADLQLRRAVAADVHLFFDWVNDSEVRLQSLRTDPIRFADHFKWFDGRLARQETCLFVLTAGDLPVGQVRFDIVEGWAHIDYSIDRFFRGRGWASRLMTLGMHAMPRGTRFHASVKAGNPGSAAVFTRLGFEEKPERTPDGLRVFRHEALACE
jgi:RimJ/RimL family protein N-acetyltransferase